MMSSTELRIKGVGLAGVGTMGKCMVDRLIANGYKVAAYDPFPAAQDYARGKGATVVQTPADLAQNANLIILSLPAPKQVFDVISGENGLIDELTGEHVVVDTSTVDPETSRKAAEMAATRGAGYMDAPILGRPSAVGNWLMPSGGSEKVIDFARPALLTFAKNVVRVGDIGAGNAVKLLNQLMFSVINGISTEVMALAEKVGVDRKVFYDVVANSGAATVSGLFRETAGRVANGNFDNPTFTVELLCKDASLGLEMAKKAGVNPLIAGFVQIINENAKGKGLAKKDTSAVAKVFEELFSKLEV